MTQASENVPLLAIEGVSAGYGAEPVLHGIDLTLAAGEIVTLIGSNGAGKSTLVQTVSGLKRPLSGRVLLEGWPITDLSPAARLERGIAHVPEGRQVFASMTVRENLQLGGRIAERRPGHAERLAEVFARFPVLREREADVVANFSGGQQQMLAIARGLMSGPRLLILDEPSLGLSPLLVQEVFKLVQALRDRGLTILLAEQNARAALAIADRAYVIENGRITLSGRAGQLLASSDIAERYLGRAAAGRSEAAPEDLAARLAACIA